MKFMFARNPAEADVRLTCLVVENFSNDCMFDGTCRSIINAGVDTALILNVLRLFGVKKPTFRKVDTYEAIRESIVNGSTDVACCSSSSDPYLEEHLDDIGTTSTVYNDKPTFIVREPDGSLVVSNSRLVTNNFDLKTALILLGIFLLLYYGTRCSPSLTSAVRTAVTAFFLALTLLLGVFSNFLSIGLFLPPKGRLPFNSLAELIPLVRSNSAQLARLRGDPVYETLLTEMSAEERADLMDALAIGGNPLVEYDDQSQFIEDLIAKPNLVGLYWHAGAQFLLRASCKLAEINDPAIPGQPINDLFALGSSNNYFQRLVSEVDVGTDPSCGFNAAHTMSPLNLTQLMEIFTLLAAACLIGCLIFAGEFFGRISGIVAAHQKSFRLKGEASSMNARSWVLV